MGKGISDCWYLEKLKFYLRDFLPSVWEESYYNNGMFLLFFLLRGECFSNAVF